MMAVLAVREKSRWALTGSLLSLLLTSGHRNTLLPQFVAVFSQEEHSLVGQLMSGCGQGDLKEPLAQVSSASS